MGVDVNGHTRQFALDLLALVKRIAPVTCPMPGHKAAPSPDCLWCEAVAAMHKAETVLRPNPTSATNRRNLV